MADTLANTPATSTAKDVPEIVLDDEDEAMDTSLSTSVNGASHTTLTDSAEINGKSQNGESTKISAGENGLVKADEDCITLDDDDDETPAKKAKPSNEVGKKENKEDELTNYLALLDRLESYIKTAFDKKDNVERKLLDALLAAINIQVQKEPYSVRKLILDKQLVLPNTISFPPSQVVDLIIEHDPEAQLGRVITKMFGDDRPKLTESEKRERLQLKNTYPAPAMTKLLVEIGQDLVQESTYSDIVHARNLPEVPKNVETYKQVAAQLKPVWEGLRDKNQPFKLVQHFCTACDFRTDSLVQLSTHKQTIHIAKDNRKFQCAFCPEYDTNMRRLQQHIVEVHATTPLVPEEPAAKIQCPICENNFQYKGQRDAHLKICKRDFGKLNSIQGGRIVDQTSAINASLWPKPPADPSITVQQQDAHAKASLKMKQEQQKRILAAAAARAQAHAQQQQQQAHAKSLVLAQQQLTQQLKNMTPQQQAQLEAVLKPRGGVAHQGLLNALQAHFKTVSNSALAQSLTPQQIQQFTKLLSQTAVQQQQRRSGGSANILPAAASRGGPSATGSRKPITTAAATAASSAAAAVGRGANPAGTHSASAPRVDEHVCEICDDKHRSRNDYLQHLKVAHNIFRNRTAVDLDSGPPLACSRCRDRFWSYEGLERHLVMNHNLVTSDLLVKAQNKLDGGRCKHCYKSFAFNILQHLASDHGAKLCSAEIMFSCDVCPFKCSSYQNLETHLNEKHPKNGRPR